MKHRIVIVALLAPLLACGVEQEPTPAIGEAAGSARMIDEEHRGYLVYRRYCAACHGLFADGRGPVASALVAPPADLTRLRERLGSPLERDALVALIDGRSSIRAHGTSDMPVWGDVMLTETPEVPEKEWAKTKILESIAEYLIAIQRDDPAPR